MKKQVNLTMKAHLLRRASYFLLIITVGAISFALAQEKKIEPQVFPVAAAPAAGVLAPNAPDTVQYVVAQIGGNIVPGTTDVGNHSDDLTTTVALPFPYVLYDQTFTSVTLSSNGNAQFTTTDSAFTNNCLPWVNHNYTIFPYWDDLTLATAGFGIFTSTSGVAPNRIFNIEWRAQYFGPTGSANFELRLYEGQTRFDVIYGTISNGIASATAGVQRDNSNLSQYFCNGTGGAATGGQSYILTPWSAGPNMPSALVRSVGVYFPADGNFYSVGGRTSDVAGSDFQHVLRYSPSTNAWTQKAVTLPDNQMNNMACGVLTVSGTPLIYCVGGSAAGQTAATARVFFYNPVTDVATTLASQDNWPGATGTILPGGFAVAGNKLYIIGGFNTNVASTNQIWQFDPTQAVGSKWAQKANAPQGVMYAPTATVGGVLYVGGASDYSGGTVIDTNHSFSFNPGSNVIGAILAIPRATGETRALSLNNQIWVMGGGRVSPNPSNEVDVYNPTNNTWTTAQPFTTARRNFATDTDGGGRIWVAGGYATDGITPLNSLEILCSNCPTPTPTATATATATATPTATPTATATATATPTATPGSFGNVSTRLQVGTGNNFLFAGFIIQGNASKTVLIRSIAPSLSQFGVPNVLADPKLELHDANNTIGTNDNWQTTQIGGVITSDQVSAIQNSGLKPNDPAEPAIIATLQPGQYSAIVKGVGDTQGVATVELYDLSPNNGAVLANISTRGFIQTGDNVMIGGLILVGNTSKVMVRAIGPSLTQFGINNALTNPQLELHDANGTLARNDDWQTTQLGGIIVSDQSAEIQNSGLAPTNPAESAIIATLAPGNYTAIAQGVNGGTGVGVIDVYALP